MAVSSAGVGRLALARRRAVVAKSRLTCHGDLAQGDTDPTVHSEIRRRGQYRRIPWAHRGTSGGMGPEHEQIAARQSDISGKPPACPWRRSSRSLDPRRLANIWSFLCWSFESEIRTHVIAISSATASQHQLHDVEVAGAEAGLAVGQVERPHSPEGLIETQAVDVGLSLGELLPPASQCGCIALARRTFDQRRPVTCSPPTCPARPARRESARQGRCTCGSTSTMTWWPGVDHGPW